MRTGKELIVATRPYAVEDRKKSWFYTLSTFFLMMACYAATFWNINLLAKIICSILSGMVTVRMFVIYHDYLHHSILYKSKPANLLFTLFGIWVLVPSSIWKRSHDYHHNHNSKLFSASIGSYPIMTRQKFLSLSKLERFSYLSVRHPLNIIFGYFTVFIYGMCVQSFLSAPKKHYDSLIALVAHFIILISVFIFFGWQTVFLSIMLPFFITFAIGAYLFYAQHNFPGVKFKDNIEWSYDHAALESSSYMKMTPFMNWMTANIGYHHIHHINSRIPFYRLPEAMAAIPELQNAQTTSFKLNDIIACLRLKVWDPEVNKMISLKGV